MSYKIAMVGQKGGVGKSTLARIIAVEATKGGLKTKIADMDTQQSTSVNWAARRAEKGIEPQIRVEPFRSVGTALKDAEGFDLYIFDGAPHSSQETRQTCQSADMVIIPTSEGLDDLHPSVILCQQSFERRYCIRKDRFCLVHHFGLNPRNSRSKRISRPNTVQSARR